jgi:hypothetical protein
MNPDLEKASAFSNLLSQALPFYQCHITALLLAKLNAKKCLISLRNML